MYNDKGDLQSIVRTVEKQIKLLMKLKEPPEHLTELVRNLKEIQHEAYFKVGQLDKSLGVLRSLIAEQGKGTPLRRLHLVETLLSYAFSAGKFDYVR